MTATTANPTMTVTVTLNLEVDPSAWVAVLPDGENVTCSQVRKDVAKYIRRELARVAAVNHAFVKAVSVK